MEETLRHVLKQVFALRLMWLRREIAPLGLSPGQPPILYLLRQKGWRTQKEIAEELCLSPATVTAILVRMERAGLVTREPDPGDLRRTRISLTQKAVDVLKECDKVNERVDAALYRGFTEEEKLTLMGYLKRMAENLKENGEKA